MDPISLDDQQLVEAFLARPPLRHLLPSLGRRRPNAAELRQRQALYRALSCTEHELVHRLLFSALTEPIYRERGSMARVEPFAALPEAARVARLSIREGWGFDEIHERLAGLAALWEALEHTQPDTWRAADVAGTLVDWHGQGMPVGQIHRSIEAALALWRSDTSEPGAERLRHFTNFLAGLVEVF